jgi:galactokinase
MINARPLDDFSHPEIGQMLSAAKSLFGGRNCWVVRVPARLCLVADHTDYWEVFSPQLVTFASDSCAMQAIISPRDDSLVRMCSFGFEDHEFDLNGDSPPSPGAGIQWLDWLEGQGMPIPHWSNYVRGPVRHAQMHHNVKNGFDILIDSNIPPSSGASSSSALTICAAVAIRLANGLPLDQVSLAKDTADAEWYVGTRGGMMDHATMVFAERGKMLRLTFRPFSAQALDSIDELNSCKFVTIFTHPSDKGSATQLAFNARALAARDVIPKMLENPAEELPDVLSVTEISGDVMRKYPALQAAGDGELRVKDWLSFARGEFDRSQEMQVLLHTNGEVATMGSYMNQAWRDAGELYGIRTPQMDRIADVCLQCDGVLGLKVMGAGFGGNLLALVRDGSLDDLRALLEKNSTLFTRPVDEAMLVHRPGQGVSILAESEGDMNWAPLWANEGE